MNTCRARAGARADTHHRRRSEWRHKNPSQSAIGEAQQTDLGRTGITTELPGETGLGSDTVGTTRASARDAFGTIGGSTSVATRESSRGRLA